MDYLAALDRLPLPDGADVERIMVEIVRSEPGISVDRLEATVLERLGRSPEDGVGIELISYVMEDLTEDGGPLRFLAPDRTVHVEDLTDGIVLTHRLTDQERAMGTLNAAFDLAGFLGWEQLSLRDGRLIDVVSSPPGDELWMGPERTEVQEPWLPVRAEDLVLGLQFDDRTSFAAPRRPLAGLADGAGLEVRGDEAAHHESVWYTSTYSRRLWRVTDATDDDRSLTDRILRVLDLADIACGADPAVVAEVSEHPEPVTPRTALEYLLDDVVLRVVAAELFDRPDLGEAEWAGPFVEVLLQAAAKPAETSVARFLACLQAERCGDVTDAEGPPRGRRGRRTGLAPGDRPARLVRVRPGRSSSGRPTLAKPASQPVRRNQPGRGRSGGRPHRGTGRTQ